MDGLVVVASALGLLAVMVALRYFGDGPPHLVGLFRYRGPEWPRGVQEDDDARWAWHPPAPDPERPPVERLRPRVRAGRGPDD